ncbi:something about silencing protein 10-like [Scleropages formosus]|uniref:Something about silencing protein 10-like n=1 Tax=Scleropages formosus TaxID=113540 RepID=A0A0P7UPS6_SCLFO|nr:something about silencing protein 10-like [Scleropages formosus]
MQVPDKKLLAHGVQEDDDQEDIDDEEEVMPLDDFDSEEEEEVETDMESDLEGKKEDEGKSKDEAEAEEEEEEEEAKSIQKRLEFAVEEEGEVQKAMEKDQKIVKDLKAMSQKEKLRLLKKESPELMGLIQDFKVKLTELRDELQPLLEMVKSGQIPAGKGAEYLKTKQQLYLNYCTNISFYLVLKAKRIPAQNHPVIERLVSYRNLINDLAEVDARLAPQLRMLLSGALLESTIKKPASNPPRKVTRDAVLDACEESESNSDLDEEAALRFYREVEKRLKQKRKRKQPQPMEILEEEEDVDPDSKRGITYQMAKNKGLTPKRKKIDRNPRVKHREKFRRAKIRRRGQVQEVHKEMERYGGEISGIRAGVKKSIKLK